MSMVMAFYFLLMAISATVLAGLVIWIGREALFAITMLHGPVFVPSKRQDIQTMIALADLQKSDKIIDLGSGDGEILLALGRAGYRAIGIEINPLLVRRSRKRIEKAGLENKLGVMQGSFWDVDFSKYDVLFLYGTSYIMKKLEKKLAKEVRAKARLVSNYFQLPNWQAVKQQGKIRVYQRSD